MDRTEVELSESRYSQYRVEAEVPGYGPDNAGSKRRRMGFGSTSDILDL